MKKPSQAKPKPHSKSPGALQKMTFSAYLQKLFGETSAENVLEVFEQLGLQPPQDGGEFLAGAEGGLVFLNQYGLVIRIEYADPENGRFGWSRVDDSGWILRPLAGIEAGHAYVEICPGCNLEKDEAKIDYLKERLKAQQIDFWDTWLVNIGRVPISTEQFPDGMPVVIDRLAVNALAESVAPVAKVLAQDALDAAEVQETLYAPLREALEAAWPDKTAKADAEKMKTFWLLCEKYVADGKMVAGWNQALRGAYYKADIVLDAAAAYERLVRGGEQRSGDAGCELGKNFRAKARAPEQDNATPDSAAVSKSATGKKPKP